VINYSNDIDRARSVIEELVASTAEPAFAVGAGGEVIAWNRGIEELLGRPATEVIGTPCHDVLCGRDSFGNRYCDRHCALHGMAHREEPVHSFELVAKGGDGHDVPVRLSVLRMSAGSGHFLLHVLQPIAETQPTAKNDRTSGTLPAPWPVEELTPRELEVLQLLAGGSSTQDIAETLHIGITTVRSHVQNIISKLGAHSKLEAVASAYRLGII
jgi:PAS domain S-box-containing protein